MSKSCLDCVFCSKGEYSGYVCDYPVPAYLQIRSFGGNFLNLNEANSCAVYKTKLDVVKDTLKDDE